MNPDFYFFFTLSINLCKTKSVLYEPDGEDSSIVPSVGRGKILSLQWKCYFLLCNTFVYLFVSLVAAEVLRKYVNLYYVVKNLKGFKPFIKI